MFDFKVQNLFRRVASIEIANFTEWKSGKNFDGGCYSFTAVHKNIGGKFETHYFTSSTFDYCEACGVFYTNGHDDCDFQTIDSLSLMMKIIQLSKENILQVSYSLQTDTIYIYYEKKGVTSPGRLDSIFQNIVRVREIGDIKKVRRKIEDKLRKSSERDIINLALEFGF